MIKYINNRYIVSIYFINFIINYIINKKKKLINKLLYLFYNIINKILNIYKIIKIINKLINFYNGCFKIELLCMLLILWINVKLLSISKLINNIGKKVKK
jgi:hypothetical protein